MTYLIRSVVVGIISTMFLSNCGGDKGNPSNSQTGTDPIVNNSPDDFQFQSTDNQNISTLLDYPWSNSGTQATITHASTVNSGTALLYLYDGNGQLVYSNGLSASAVEQSQVGVAGNWLIRISMNNFWGELNFRSQKL